MTIFECQPHNDLLQNRSWNEAYCTARPGVEYAVFFPDGGNVLLDVSAVGDRPVTVRWLAIRESRWVGETSAVAEEDGCIRLVTPVEEDYWAALVNL
jgi:hypothetical protein